MSGIVYLVGAGPGDPGLLTMRGAQLLGRAQVLVYDYLAAPELLNLAPQSARRIYVGKMSGNHAKTQDEINHILVEEAKAGHVVVRLKGGDPYIFGRGGEEALALIEAGIFFEEVPGISSTIAAAAYAGIPLTHRGLSSQAALITGNESPDKEDSSHDWSAIAKMGTISMVMGVKNLESACKAIIEHGRSATTPAALIQWGTTNRQRSICGTLESLPSLAKEHNFTPPALFVAGDVVSLSSKLNWFEQRPLFGKKILVTRSRRQASRLSEGLRELGAEVWERATIEVKPLEDISALKNIFPRLPEFAWLVFTSPNGARIFMETLFSYGMDARALAGSKIAVVGPGTAEALRPFGLKEDLMPQRDYVAEGLLEALLETGVENKKIILARALEARDVLPDGLKRAGAHVTDMPIYVTNNPTWAEQLPSYPDLVTFTSSSTAAGLASLIPEEERHHFPAASIGGITSSTAKSFGFPVVLEAPQSSIDSLLRAISLHFITTNEAGK